MDYWFVRLDNCGQIYRNKLAWIYRWHVCATPQDSTPHLSRTKQTVRVTCWWLTLGEEQFYKVEKGKYFCHTKTWWVCSLTRPFSNLDWTTAFVVCTKTEYEAEFEAWSWERAQVHWCSTSSHSFGEKIGPHSICNVSPLLRSNFSGLFIERRKEIQSLNPRWTTLSHIVVLTWLG